MKPSHAAPAAFAFVVILYSFTGLRGGAVDTCKWFNDNLNADRSVGTMTRQTDLLYNRIALPVDANVTVGNTAVTNEGGQVVDFKLGSATICSTAEALYGPTPEPSPAP
jgi:hypothetical protein